MRWFSKLIIGCRIVVSCYHVVLGQKYLLLVSSVFEDKFKIMQFVSCRFHVMMRTNMTTIPSHQEDLGPSMLDVKYEGLGGTGFVTTPLNMAPNLSECNVSHGGIALLLHIVTIIFSVTYAPSTTAVSSSLLPTPIQSTFFP